MRTRTATVKRVSPSDPSGVGPMFHEPGKQNAHIARAKARAKEAEMASKTRINIETAQDADRKASTMAKDDDKKAADADKNFSVADVDKLTPPHLQDNAKGVDKMRFGVSADEGPVPTVDQAGKTAIEGVRADEQEQAKLLYDRSTWTYVGPEGGEPKAQEK